MCITICKTSYYIFYINIYQTNKTTSFSVCYSDILYSIMVLIVIVYILEDDILARCKLINYHMFDIQKSEALKRQHIVLDINSFLLSILAIEN
jgi:hypothetical protein